VIRFVEHVLGEIQRQYWRQTLVPLALATIGRGSGHSIAASIWGSGRHLSP
jgi:hypothetical protein